MRKYKHLHYGLKKNSTLSTILKTYFFGNNYGTGSYPEPPQG